MVRQVYTGQPSFASCQLWLDETARAEQRIRVGTVELEPTVTGLRNQYIPLGHGGTLF